MAISPRVGFLLLFGAIVVLVGVIAWPFVKAAFLAFTLSILFAPLYRFAREKCRLHRYIASIATTIAISVCVLLPLTVMATIVITQAGHFLQGFIAQVEVGSLADAIGTYLASIHHSIENLIGQAPPLDDVRGAIFGALKTGAAKLYQFSPQVLSTTFSVVGNFFLMLLLLAVFFAEGERLLELLREMVPISSDHWRELANEVRITIASSLSAALITAFVQGSLLGLGFWIAGFHQPYGWWLVAVILSIIPVIGAASCYLTATFLLLSMGNTNAAIIFLLYGFGVVSMIDNVIRSVVVRSTVRIHPVLLFLILLGAVNLAGPIGIVAGPVLLAIFLAALRIYRREFTHQQQP
ncbi:MAG: AI-2E family transporter [Deltaproteobacteria bacterium]|nr:AI-2E family transporter [Deltaproteobacteria bacterium]